MTDSPRIEALARRALEAEVASDKLASEFHDRFAQSTWPQCLGLLEGYCLDRFDLDGQQVERSAESHDSTAVDVDGVRVLDKAARDALQFARTVLAPIRADIREGVLSQIEERIEGRRLGWLSRAKAALLHKRQRNISDRPVTPAVVARRKKSLADYRREHGLTAPVFAQMVGLSDTSILGIVHEHRNRFSLEARTKLLKALNVSLDDWYLE